MAISRLLEAAQEGDIQTLKELLTAGKCNINFQSWTGSTPLHCSAKGGHTQCVQLLLQHGADTNIQAENGWTPLHVAAEYGCVQLLLQHGTDTSIQDEDGWTPLHCAAGKGHTQCVQLLFQHGADTSIQAKDGSTPLHVAAWRGHTQCVQLLLQHRADTNKQAENGWTPLHWAALLGHTQCVQLLLQHGADTSIQTKNGRTPLHMAVMFGRTQCVQLLLQHGADASIQVANGWTPLHLAVECGHTQCVQLLLQHGADASIQNKEGKTPRMLAKGKEHATVTELLRRFEIPDIQGYIQTRTLEHLAEILDPAEYSIIDQTNLSTNFPDVFQFQKVQELKDWADKNNYTNIRDIRAGLEAANLPRLSIAAVDYYAGVMKKISNMTPDEFEALCRTLVTARHMHTSRLTTTNQQGASLSLDQYRYDAFIAYSGKDEATIEPVFHQLKELGVKLWFAKEDLVPGAQVITSISEAIIASKHTVAFLSKSFVQSGWCQQELQYAMQEALNWKRDVLIPVVMNISPEEIPTEIKGLKYILFDDKELIPKLSQAIKGPQDTPTYGELRDEVEVLRDQVRLLTSKLRLQSQ